MWADLTAQVYACTHTFQRLFAHNWYHSSVHQLCR